MKARKSGMPCFFVSIPTIKYYHTMIFAINTTDGCGLSNEARCKLLPKKTSISHSFYQLFKMSSSIMKVGVACELQSF